MENIKMENKSYKRILFELKKFAETKRDKARVEHSSIKIPITENIDDHLEFTAKISELFGRMMAMQEVVFWIMDNARLSPDFINSHEIAEVLQGEFTNYLDDRFHSENLGYTFYEHSWIEARDAHLERQEQIKQA